MFTLGYPFRPWHGGQVARRRRRRSCEYIARHRRRVRHRRHIRFRHRVVARRLVVGARPGGPSTLAATARPRTVTCAFLYVCTGYYDYDQRLHARRSPASSTSPGTVVHPQHWPEDLDYAGKRVVVIGSGATAVTLVPAMADDGRARDDAAALADVRRVAAGRDPLAERLRRRLPAGLAHALIARGRTSLRHAGLLPAVPAPARSWRRPLHRAGGPAAAAGEATTSTTHFSPPYDPWDQRLCVVPDGDLFAALAHGPRRRSSPTPSTTFTETGIRLASGERARGRHRRHRHRACKLLPFGGIDAHRRRRAGRARRARGLQGR